MVKKRPVRRSKSRRGVILAKYRRWTIFAAAVVVLVLIDYSILLILPNYRTMWVPDDTLGYRNCPNANSIDYSRLLHDGRVINYFTGECGERVSSIDAVSDFRRPLIVCHGDSFTFGQGVPWEETFPAVLGRLLGSRASIVNFGVAGYTAYQSGLFLEETYALFHPAIAVFQINANDDDPEMPVRDLFNLPFPLRTRSGQIVFLVTQLARGIMRADPSRNSLRALQRVLEFSDDHELPLILVFNNYPPSVTEEQAARLLRQHHERFRFVLANYRREYKQKSGGHLNAKGHARLAGELAAFITHIAP
jgi:hypothetical protein